MGNHPLNQVGYQRLREIASSTLTKLNTYLDLQIKLTRLKLKAEEDKGES